MKEDVEEIVGIGKVGVPVGEIQQPVSSDCARRTDIRGAMPRHVHVDAHLLEILDDERDHARVVEFVRVPGAVLDAETRPVAGLPQQRARALGVVIEAPELLVVAEEAWREESLRDHRFAGEDLFVDPAAVDCVVERLPHLDSVERRG